MALRVTLNRPSPPLTVGHRIEDRTTFKPVVAEPTMRAYGTERHWSVVGFRRVAAVGRGASVGEGTQLCLVGYRRSSERRGTEGRQTALPLRSASPLHSSSHCSRRFGASRSLRSLDPATSDGWCCAHAGACSGRSLYQPTDLRLCLRKTLGRRLTARSTLRSSSSAKLRSSSRRRPRRRPRGARATRVAQLSATSSAYACRQPSDCRHSRC